MAYLAQRRCRRELRQCCQLLAGVFAAQPSCDARRSHKRRGGLTARRHDHTLTELNAMLKVQSSLWACLSSHAGKLKLQESQHRDYIAPAAAWVKTPR